MNKQALKNSIIGLFKEVSKAFASFKLASVILKIREFDDDDMRVIVHRHPSSTKNTRGYTIRVSRHPPRKFSGQEKNLIKTRIQRHFQDSHSVRGMSVESFNKVIYFDFFLK